MIHWKTAFYNKLSVTYIYRYIDIHTHIGTTIFDQIGGAYCEAPLKDRDFILGSFERTRCKLGIGIVLKI